MSKPHEMTLFADDIEFQARYDFEAGEDQWFDAMKGVGSPGYGPCVALIEVNFGSGWEPPENYPQLNVEAIEDELLTKHLEAEADGGEEAAYYDSLERGYAQDRI